MKPKSTEHTPQRDAFCPELADIINPKHELVALTRTIDWERCEAELIDLYEGVQNSVSASDLQADMIRQPAGKVNRQLRQRQVPVLDRMGPPFSRFQHTTHHSL